VDISPLRRRRISRSRGKNEQTNIKIVAAADDRVAHIPRRTSSQTTAPPRTVTATTTAGTDAVADDII
jgi:hypothetical protein